MRVYAMFSRNYTGLSASNLRHKLASLTIYERNCLLYIDFTELGLWTYGS